MPRQPVRLRRGGMTGNVYALRRYRQTGATLEASDKDDVTADFDSLVLEELMPDPSSCLTAALDGAARRMELNEDERREIGEFRERLVGLIERHNGRSGDSSQPGGGRR